MGVRLRLALRAGGTGLAGYQPISEGEAARSGPGPRNRRAPLAGVGSESPAFRVQSTPGLAAGIALTVAEAVAATKSLRKVSLSSSISSSAKCRSSWENPAP